MLALPDYVKNKYDVSSMQYAAHTGAKCPVDVMREMIDWWGPVFRDAYEQAKSEQFAPLQGGMVGKPRSVGR